MLTCYLGKRILYYIALPVLASCVLSVLCQWRKTVVCVFRGREQTQRLAVRRGQTSSSSLSRVCSSWEKEARLGRFAQVGFQETSSCNSRVFILYWGGEDLERAREWELKGFRKWRTRGYWGPQRWCESVLTECLMQMAQHDNHRLIQSHESVRIVFPFNTCCSVVFRTSKL